MTTDTNNLTERDIRLLLKVLGTEKGLKIIASLGQEGLAKALAEADAIVIEKIAEELGVRRSFHNELLDVPKTSAGPGDAEGLAGHQTKTK